MPKRSNTNNKRKASKARSTPSPPDECDRMVATIDGLMAAKKYREALKGLILFRVIAQDGDDLQQVIDQMIRTCHDRLFEEIETFKENCEHAKVIETLRIIKDTAEYVINGNENVTIFQGMIDELIDSMKELL